MINTKTNLKHKVMALRFAIWDLHLYLDTHECDEKARELLEEYMEQYRDVLDEYLCKCGPISIKDDNRDKWLCTPFPWVNTGSDC